MIVRLVHPKKMTKIHREVEKRTKTTIIFIYSFLGRVAWQGRAVWWYKIDEKT